MFSDLYDYISLLFYRQWPKVEGEIIAMRIPSGNGQLLLDCRFSLGDGYYTGEASCPSWFAGTININGRFRIGQPVAVCYRRDNPNINKLDRNVWQDLEGL